MASRLEIRLLGDCLVALGDEVLRALDAPRLQALLTYVVLHPDAPQPRPHVAFRFWPDSSEPQALTNLRNLLHQLRTGIPDVERWIHIDRRSIQWRPRAPARVDALDLTTEWGEADRAAEAGDLAAAIAAGERACALYAGDLLPGCYDRWIEPHRARLRRAALDGTARLAGWLEARRDYRSAVLHVERLREMDPLREETYRSLIRLHALTGEVGKAARAFRECAATLERELGVEPSEGTRALYERVREASVVDPSRDPTLRARPSHPPLVGRGEEWAWLGEAWERARRGRSGVVLVSGEAGIGKTHLAEALVDWARRQGVTTATARCYAAEGLLPFGPVAQWLRTDRLRAGVAEMDDVWLAEVSRLLPEVLERRPELAPTSGSGEAWRRVRLFEALARAALGKGDPLLLLLDDLQWCDGDTLQWLHYLVRFAPDAPLLLLATLRSGEPPADARLSSWLLQLRQVGAIEEIALGPLGAPDTAALATHVAGRKLEAEEAAELHAETEGNPLFVVETVRSRVTPTDGVLRTVAGGERTLPGRAHAVIRARLEQLSPDARELVQLLATVGRGCSLEVLRAATPDAREATARALDELVHRHLVREEGVDDYDFTHDRIREAAYREAGAARRALLHERIARALSAAYAAAPDRVAGEIARHLERAGLGDEAIPYHRRAADRALAVYANEEAAAYLERALALLEGLPDTHERAATELELQTCLGVPFVAMDHYSGPRVWRVYRRARSLSERLGVPTGAPVLRALALASLMRSRLPEVRRLGEELMAAAERDRDPMYRVEAHYVLGVASYWQGRVTEAEHRLAQAIELYDPRRRTAHIRLFAQDPAIVCGIRLALAQWHRGEVEAARARCLDALAKAEDLAHPFSLAYGRLFGAWVLIECGDLPSVRAHIEALLGDSEKHGFAVWPAMGGIVLGWLRVEEGRVTDGLEAMQEAMARYASQEVNLGLPYHQGLFARACRNAGRHEEALAAIDEGLEMSDRTGERFWDAELHRLRGEVLHDTRAPADEVDASLARAAETARRQGAPALVRRAERSRNALLTGR